VGLSGSSNTRGSKSSHTLNGQSTSHHIYVVAKRLGWKSLYGQSTSHHIYVVAMAKSYGTMTFGNHEVCDRFQHRYRDETYTVEDGLCSLGEKELSLGSWAFMRVASLGGNHVTCDPNCC
jgi:hypothetical protein